MKRFALLLAVAAVAALAKDDENSAKGNALIQFGPNREQISFSAESRVGSTVAEGRADVRDITAGVEVRIDVNCLNVQGNTATISGVVVRSSNEARVPVGFESIFQVVDGGGKAPDFMSLANFFEVGVGNDCNAPGEFDLAQVEQGNIRVE